MDEHLLRRARRHHALGDPVRLAIVDELAASDRAPSELGRRFGLTTNLLAHHLDVLEHAEVIRRFTSSGDRRRRYVSLAPGARGDIVVTPAAPDGPVLFVCTRNSARSPLAAALWCHHTGAPATSAGTDPAEAVHPGAVAAARRAGLDLGDTRPRHLGDIDVPATVITVCDRAHEDLTAEPTWWHWSIPDPVPAATADAFDAALADLDHRVRALVA